MPIIRLLQNEPLGPEDIEIVSAVYEQTLSSLGLVDQTDPLTEIVAKKIIECAQTGERDPVRLREGAFKRRPRAGGAHLERSRSAAASQSSIRFAPTRLPLSSAFSKEAKLGVCSHASPRVRPAKTRCCGDIPCST